MKQLVLLFLSLVFVLVSVQPAAAVMRPVTTPTESTEAVSAAELEKAKAEWSEMSRKEKKEMRKQLRKDLKKAVKEQKAAAADTNTLLLVIITILLPPLGMLIYDGASNRFLISLLLTLLFYLPGLIYTLVVILGGK